MPTPRTRRIRQVAAAVVAATAVVLGPTACDIGIGAGGSLDPAAGGAAPTSVVPVGSVEDLEPTRDAEPDEAPDAPGSAAPESDAPGSAAPGSAAPESDEPGTTAPETTDAETPATEAPESEAPAETTTAAPTSAETTAPAAPAAPNTNGLEVLGTDCTNSDLEPHTGFQEAPRCVSSSHGEVASADNSPSLLITDFPATVAAGEAFDIQVSTRNLVRDRFLGAAAGGYYLESSFLNEDGIQRGHFHTACRILPSSAEAPDAEPVPAFFLATQDNGGGAEADQVVVPVSGGLDEPGTYQCSVWAGDGSHRTPLMQRANQTPAFDSVRITVG